MGTTWLRWAVRTSLVTALVAMGWSCGADGEGLFGTGQSDDDDGGAGADGSGGDDATSTSSSTSSSSTTTSSSSSSSGTGGSTTEGPELPCDDRVCTGGLVCCVDPPGNDGGEQETKCSTAGSCGEGFYQISCRNNDDCPGAQVCCGYFDVVDMHYVGVSCTPSCQSSETTFARYMCADDPTSCPSFTVCTDSQSLPDGYSYCAQ